MRFSSDNNDFVIYMLQIWTVLRRFSVNETWANKASWTYKFTWLGSGVVSLLLPACFFQRPYREISINHSNTIELTKCLIISRNIGIAESLLGAIIIFVKGTERFKMLLSQANFDMNVPLLPVFPSISASEISQAVLRYPWFNGSKCAVGRLFW